MYICLEPNFTAIGPFVDSSDRNLRFGPQTYGFDEISCYFECYENFVYFSLQDGDGNQNGAQCFCENDLTHATRDGSGNCGVNGGASCNYIYAINPNLNHVGQYIGVSIKKDWISAESYCLTTFGTHLASIKNDDENLGVRVAATKEGLGEDTVWIGLNRFSNDKAWTFIGWNTTTSYGKWNTNTPIYNDNQTSQNCGQQLPEISPLAFPWINSACGIENYFVCNAPNQTTIIS